MHKNPEEVKIPLLEILDGGNLQKFPLKKSTILESEELLQLQDLKSVNFISISNTHV